MSVTRLKAVDPVRAATMFWRLAVLRRQLERTRMEIELLRQLARDDDLRSRMREAGDYVGRAVDYLTPEPAHVDNAMPADP